MKTIVKKAMLFKNADCAFVEQRRLGLLGTDVELSDSWGQMLSCPTLGDRCRVVWLLGTDVELSGSWGQMLS